MNTSSIQSTFLKELKASETMFTTYIVLKYRERERENERERERERERPNGLPAIGSD